MTQAVKFLTLLSLLVLMPVMAQSKSTDFNMSEVELEQGAMFIQQMMNSPQAKAKFQQEKDQMPKMLKMMKSFASCLEGCSSQKDADRCVEKASKLSQKLGLDEDFSDDEDPFIWDENTKEQVLAEFQENIQRVEQIMPCIEKAENMMDIMKCNQDMEQFSE
ncbi:hypothetical protein JWG39_07130 [Desulforhopalus vacuolatus]|uniref:hypothetical protein n=1 Tax=Desulforhopalus vacuolatus TaxID=40414 RepID=UPI001966AD2B|nr:hypothetical protein [Desulforhopalus vacuolatus]MBM9519592.1 hypothetical protein [Desulforhopalus vacuolatus]